MGRIFKKDQPRKTGSPLAVHIGAVLLSLRQDRQVTLRDVSAATGLSNAFICQLENGQSCPTAETLWKLSQFFGVGPEAFFAGYK